MNILYVDVDNPLLLAVENFPCSQVTICAENGTLLRTNDSCRYIYRTGTRYTPSELIYIGVTSNSSIIWIDTLSFRLRYIPMEYSYVGETNKWIADKQEILNNPFVSTGFFLLDFDYQAEVINYSFYIRRNHKVIYIEENIQGCSFTPSVADQISRAQSGDFIMFFDIIASNNINDSVSEIHSYCVYIN